MPKKMLIDATHAEETRVVVVDGNRVEEFDFESEAKRQLAGNIYLAKVTRVEPSLQAAFIEYGGNRHGFLAFAEIHPDYYQIPIADREALLAEEEADARAEEARASRAAARGDGARGRDDAGSGGDGPGGDGSRDEEADDEGPDLAGSVTDLDDDDQDDDDDDDDDEETGDEASHDEAPAMAESMGGGDSVSGDREAPVEPQQIRGMETLDGEGGDAWLIEDTPEAASTGRSERRAGGRGRPRPSDKDPEIEQISEDEGDLTRRPKPRVRRYKIQEVVKVRQILLVQVLKEERGNKGAALTTYLSLAGRYCVLMPNTARGGGISRKITNAADRKKLKEIASEIALPRGAGLIVRTAGAKRTKPEIRRDYEYLQRLWEQVRELTLKSIAPAKIYEEGDLIKRTIRDLYSREIDEVIVDGEAGYRSARDFMRMIMPAHAESVVRHADPVPLFARYQVESYLAGMFNPTVQLRSGGYIVVGITEALVAIDVNSGRATKQGSVEETALQTNLEAAEEIARQVKLRDLAGLIVIDFIDMDDRRNNAAVEKRFKDALKTDRARIQIGRISGFGLLEMSRQRMRPGMIEATTQACPACHGTGLIRSDESLALAIIRQVEEEGVRDRSKEVLVRAPVGVVNYLFNNKREHLAAIEARTDMAVRLEADARLVSPDFALERFKTRTRTIEVIARPVISADASLMDDIDEAALADEEVGDEADVEAEGFEAADEADDDADDRADETEAEADAASAAGGTAADAEAEGDDGSPRKKRRRRRRRGGKGRDGLDAGERAEGGYDEADDAPSDAAPPASSEDDPAEEGRRVTRRRRSRTGPGLAPVAAAVPEAPMTADAPLAAKAPAAIEDAPPTAEAGAVEAQTAEAQTAEARTAEVQPVGSEASEGQAPEVEPVEVEPAEVEAGEAEAGEARPIEGEAAEAQGGADPAPVPEPAEPGAAAVPLFVPSAQRADAEVAQFEVAQSEAVPLETKSAWGATPEAAAPEPEALGDAARLEEAPDPREEAPVPEAVTVEDASAERSEPARPADDRAAPGDDGRDEADREPAMADAPSKPKRRGWWSLGR